MKYRRQGVSVGWQTNSRLHKFHTMLHESYGKDTTLSRCVKVGSNPTWSTVPTKVKREINTLDIVPV